MLKIYTRVGDQGFTKQVTGKMVPKCDLQIEALGNVDELQSYLGVTIANLSPNCEELKPELENIQRQLYQLQADIVVKRHNEINSEKLNRAISKYAYCLDTHQLYENSKKLKDVM